MRWRVLVVITMSCSADPPAKEPPAYGGDHPLDEAVHPTLVRDGITFVEAPPAELCRRLFADLIGRFPSKQEVANDCEGRSVDAIARELQSRPEYLLVSERHWRDRMGQTESFLDWRYFRDLYARIDALHLGNLRYDDFAHEVTSHPAFFLESDTPVKVAFSVFLGRPANEAEEVELYSLYRPWFITELPDPDFPYAMVYRAAFDPEECEYGGGCSTELFGGAELKPRGEATTYEDMSTGNRRAAQAIGELISSQPVFWENAADEILDRLLGWSDGGRAPRRPGTLLPELRQALADWLEDTGDYPGAERLVMTSQLYRMSNETTAEQVWASGPMKAARAEVWLDTMLGLLEYDAGTCDVRYLGHEAIFVLYEAFELGIITEAQLIEDIRRLHQLMEDRRPFGDGWPDETYEYLAGIIGGCPLTAADRYEASGLAFGYAQEALSHLLCLDGLGPSEDTLAGEVEHQTRVLLGRDPTEEELQVFEEEMAGCTTCRPEEQASSVCIALSGTAEMLFY